MATIFHDKKIKSADRVLEIFEMFSETRRSVTVMEVARALDVPQSSTSELLSNLVRRGYLSRQRGGRVFRPTARIALLGAWVHPALFRHGSLLGLMDSLHEQTGFAVSLGSMIGVSLKHVHSVGDVPEGLESGSERHLLHSPFGHVLLSMKFGEDIRLLVQRINAQSEAEDHVLLPDLTARLKDVSKQASAVGAVAPDWTGIAVLLPQAIGEEQLAIGLIVPTNKIDDGGQELLRCLRRSISNHIGPRVVSNTTNMQPVPLQRFGLGA